MTWFDKRVEWSLSRVLLQKKVIFIFLNILHVAIVVLTFLQTSKDLLILISRWLICLLFYSQPLECSFPSECLFDLAAKHLSQKNLYKEGWSFLFYITFSHLNNLKLIRVVGCFSSQSNQNKLVNWKKLKNSDKP